MRASKSILLTWLVVGLGVAGPSFSDDSSYIVEERGSLTMKALFDRKMDTPSEQWEKARAAQNDGKLRKANRGMLYLFRRWPNSMEAPWAARAHADILLARGDLADAFNAYQFLIDNYSSRMADYDTVLECQFEIAERIMNRRHLVWLLGGYRSPEYAVDYFEKVIRNGPQWSRADEAQFMIGRCHQEAGDLELAVAAYALLGYRYSDSQYAEEGAWRQIECLQQLHEDYPGSPDVQDRILTASTVFLSTYPDSAYRADVIQLRNELYEIKARALFDTADFYAKVPKSLKAAVLYDQALIEEFPRSQLVPEAEGRKAEHEALLEMPEDEEVPMAPYAKPLPFG